jgi:cardiolipin synthase A/B
MTHSDTRLHFYFTPGETWEAMYQDCLRAKKEIVFEQYIWEDTGIGLRFLDLMTQKAEEGLRVQLLLDRVGSRTLYESDHIGQFCRAGGHISFYNPIGWINLVTPSLWFPRNHTKTLLIDREIAYIGSVCLADEMKEWRDLQLRITGNFVKEIAEHLFIMRKKLWPRLKDYYTQMRRTNKLYHFVMSLPKFMPNPIYLELRRSIHQARHSVLLVSPYFLPPWRLRRALYRAIKRGVTVSVMMGGQTDVPLADYVSRSYFPRLLRKGLTILLYQPTVLHAKYAIIDDNWATVGSTNLDYLSLLHNREANIITRHPPDVATLRGHFQKDSKHCLQAGPGQWRDLPLRHKMMGLFGRTLKRIL